MRIHSNILSLQTKITHYHIIGKVNHSNTYASYLMLKNYYRLKDYDYRDHERNKTLIVLGKITNKTLREKVFKKNIKFFGNLTCAICLKENLNPKTLAITPRGADLSNNATIEHIEPIALGGYRYATNNMICTCYDCNSKRGVLPLFEISPNIYAY